MGENLLLQGVNRELAAAGPELVDNGDLLRGILAGCGDCIKILDLDGRLQFMSEGGKRVMEVDDFSALKGCPWPDFWAGDGNASAHEAVAAAKHGRTVRFQNAANTAKGTPRYWDVQVSPILGDDGKPTHLLSISRDITEEWRAAQAQADMLERQTFLTQELTHRVKNTLATVLAIAAQTFGDEPHRPAREAFVRRIHTLGDAYNILTETSWESGSMLRVVESAMLPYRDGPAQIAISGPDHALRPNQALTLALAINELATNAMKYGALSVPGGRVDVTWSLTDDDTLAFAWRESNGPAVTPPSRSGFGSRLIRRMLPADFGGMVDLQYAPTGVVCLLDAKLG